MSDKVFDTIRWISEVFVPALVVLLGVIFANVPLAHSEAVLAIVGAAGVFLGALVTKSRADYNRAREEEDNG